MAGFGAKVQLKVDKSGKKKFNEEIAAQISKLNVSEHFAVYQQDMKRVAKEAQEGLDKNPITIRIGKIDCSPAIAGVRKQLQTMLSSLSVENGVNITGLKDFLGTDGITDTMKQTAAGADAAVKKLEDTKKKAAELTGQLASLDLTVAALKKTMASASSGKNAVADTGDLDAFKSRYADVVNLVSDLKSKQGEQSAEAIQGIQQQAEALRLEVVEYQQAQAAAAAKEKAEQRAADAAEKAAKKAESTTVIYKQQEALYKRMENYLKANTRLPKSTRDNIQGLMTDLAGKSNMSSKEFSEIATQFDHITAVARTAGNTGRKALDLLYSAYQKFGGWMIVTKSLTTAIHSIKNMISNVRELDAAMTELKKVTDETDTVYEQFFQQATVRAQALGATVTDTINASADFARLGYSIEEAADLADAALVYKNVGDGIDDISEASESIISTMKAFGVAAEDAMQIVDKFNETGNNFAISSEGVGDALQRSASALASANNTLDESIALITAANTVVQDPDSVGKMLAQRYSNVPQVDSYIG